MEPYKCTSREKIDYNALDIFLTILPLIGLWLIWRNRKRLTPLYFFIAAALGILSLVAITLELIK